MEWITKQNSSNSMTNHSRQGMPVWFMPVAFGIALCVAVVVALVMCLRWRKMRSSADASKEEEESYEEITARKSLSRNRKRNTDKDDYETIPVMSRKTPKNSNKNNDPGEYKKLTSVRPQHEREYASLNKATCSSKTSLSSLTSGYEVKEDSSKNRTKRQGLIIPSLSNPRDETVDRACVVSQVRLLDDRPTQPTKPVKKVNTSQQSGSRIGSSNVTRSASMRPKPVIQANTSQKPESRIASSHVTRSVSMRPKPVTRPKPSFNQRQTKNVREIEYENATVVIDGNQTETRRITLENHQ